MGNLPKGRRAGLNVIIRLSISGSANVTEAADTLSGFAGAPLMFIAYDVFVTSRLTDFSVRIAEESLSVRAVEQDVIVRNL